MKLLLIAYEFPPSPSPQSLRWAYLARELARQGHAVHVLAPDIAGHGPGGLPDLPEGVTVHRCFAGPLHGLAAARSRGADARAPATETATAVDFDAIAAPEALNWKGQVRHSVLNWKGRLFERVKALAGWFLYPDARGEWAPWARRSLRRLLGELQPDLVVSSHEPATTLSLGLLAREAGFRWVADLGDPVLAPYTEPRWRRRAARLEARVCARADLVVCTTEGATALLAERHGLPASRVLVVPQGFDDRGAGEPVDALPASPLELLYTGSFYAFRQPGELLDAVVATPGVRLNVATVNAPAVLREAAARHPDKVRLLGFVAHDQVVRLQRRAHVLVNIGNQLPAQVPGKVYEYLGAHRPVLHLQANADGDATCGLLLATRRGVCISNRRDDIAAALVQLREDATRHALGERFDLRPEAVAGHAWSCRAAGLARRLEAMETGDARRVDAGSPPAGMALSGNQLGKH